MKSVSDGVCLLKPIPEGKRAHYLRLKDALTEKGTEVCNLVMYANETIFLTLPTGISVNPTGAWKCHLK